jgi:lysophospholipase L1-like esterase
MRKRKRILCIGDSITAGVVAGGGKGYVELLRKRLSRRHYEVINGGCSGTTVLDWMRAPVPDLPVVLGGAYEYAAQPHLPCDLAIVELGGNDAVGFWEVRPTEPEEFVMTLLQLSDRLIGAGTERLLLLSVVPNPGAREAVQQRLLAYRYQLMRLTGMCHAEVLDIYRLLDPERDFEPYNVHPNQRGHRKIAQAVAPVVRRLTRQPKRRDLR